jgi:hypothetical protein
MLVDLALAPTCESTDKCGRAQVCKQDHCLPCEGDAECLRGEACVLDHCVKGELAECRRAEHCQRGSLCILSGYSEGPRNNDSLSAVCMSDDEGTPLPEPEPKQLVDLRPPPLADELLSAIKAPSP